MPDAAGRVALLDLAERFLPYQPFPGKALRLLEEIRAAEESEARADRAAPIDAARVFRAFSIASGVPEALLRPDRRLDANELRASTGLSFQWRSPMGPIVVSFATPLRKKDGDETETIQFSFGPQF